MVLPLNNVIVLCGLPGSGKSFLVNSIAKAFLEYHGEVVSLYHIDYDEVFSALLQNPSANITDYRDWKAVRDEVVAQVRRILAKDNTNLHQSEANSPSSHELTCLLPPLQPLINSTNTSKTNVLILDDNMYYRSMRHAFYQLAKKYHAGFVQIYVERPVTECVTNNNTRTGNKHVPEQLIYDMAQKLEIPDPIMYSWEKHTIVYKEEQRELFSNLVTLLEDPLPDEEPLFLEQEQSRLINLASVTHQFDLRARKLIGDLILKYKTNSIQFNPKTAQALSKGMGQKKADILAELHTKSFSADSELRLVYQLENKFVTECDDLYHKLTSSS